MSYKVIEKNEYGIRVRNYSEIPDCKLCKNHAEKNTCNRSECAPNSYYLSDSEVERLESEKQKPLADEIIIIQKDKIKMLENTLEKVIDTQKELIDLQIENKQLKERVKELENNTTELSENQIAELAQIGSKYLYLGAREEGRISYGGIIEILKRYNEMCK